MCSDVLTNQNIPSTSNQPTNQQTKTSTSTQSQSKVAVLQSALMKTHTLAIFFAAVALPFGTPVVSAEGYRQRAHDLASCEDIAEMIDQRSSLVELLETISGENELAAAIATREMEKKSRQQQILEAKCNEGDRRLRLLRGARGRHQDGDGNGANCDGGEDCEKQHLGPQIIGEGAGIGRKGSGGLFGIGKCNGEGCDQQRGDGQGPGRNAGRGEGLFSIFRDTSCEDEGDVVEIIDTIEGSKLLQNNNQPAMRLTGVLETFVEGCDESE